MATCSVSEIMAESSPWGAVTHNPLRKARLVLLCQILKALDPATNCDVPELMVEGKCFCAVTMNPLEQVELALLCRIKNAVP